MLANQSSASSASKVAPVSLGFSLAEEGDGQDDSDTNGGDSKGLSHASRCARIVFWMCELTMRHTQLLSLKKSPPSLLVRRQVDARFPFKFWVDFCTVQTTSNINKWNYVQEINQDRPLAVLSSDSVSCPQEMEITLDSPICPADCQDPTHRATDSPRA